MLLTARLPSDRDVGAAHSPGPTPVTLWAWERPESLTFAAGEEIEVAVLVGTLALTSDRVRPTPRLQPLEINYGTRRTAVVRIESDRRRRPRLTVAQRQTAVEIILAWSTARPGFAALQIDFDARVSERAFYRDLLFDLRHALPTSMPLSITALASWCLGDPWLAELPIRDAVPMLFRMGIDDEAIRDALARGRDFQDPLCRSSYGLATDEPVPPLVPGRRLYLFHPRPWTGEAFQDFRQHLRAGARSRRGA